MTIYKLRIKKISFIQDIIEDTTEVNIIIFIEDNNSF